MPKITKDGQKLIAAFHTHIQELMREGSDADAHKVSVVGATLLAHPKSLNRLAKIMKGVRPGLRVTVKGVE